MKTTDETLTLQREVDDVSAPETDDASRDVLAVRLPGTRLLVGAVVIALVAGAAALFFVNRRHDQIAENAETARTVGTTHVEELLTFDHQGIDAEIEDERGWLTGDFASEYLTLMQDKIAPAAKKAQVVTKARVVAGGVESAGHDRVDLILFVNVLTESKELTEPRTSGSRLRVTVEKVDGDWRISALDPV